MLLTVEKALQVLHLFTPAEPLWGATTVAARLGIPKSTSHELLRTLEDLELLRKRTGGQYALGGLDLLGVVNGAHPWLTPARWTMYELARLTGEAVHLSILQGETLQHIEYARTEDGTASPDTGPLVLPPSGVPLQCSAMGKVLLCTRSWPEVQVLIERYGLSALTVNSIVTSDELQTELQRVREQGYAYDVEEAFSGVCCIAAPVYGAAREVLAAISVSAPAARFYVHKGTWREHLLRLSRLLAQTLADQAAAGSTDAFFRS